MSDQELMSFQQRETTDAHSLQSLFEFSRIINSSIDLKFILDNLLLTIMGKLMVARACVMLRRSEKVFRIESIKGAPQKFIGEEFIIENPAYDFQESKKILTSDGALKSLLHECEIQLIIPIFSKEKLLGAALLGPRMISGDISSDEREFLDSLINLSATAIEKAIVIDELRLVNRTLDQKIQELNTLFDLSKEFNAGLEREKVIKTLLFTLMGQIGVRRYIILLREGDMMKAVVNKVQQEIVDKKLLEELCKIELPISIADLPENFEYIKNALDRLEIKIAVPMIMHGTTQGLICLGERMNKEPYSESDKEFLSSIGGLAMILLENARLFLEAIEKQRMEDELKIAQEIQRGLLPSKLPSMAGYEIIAVNVPSRQVGGDTYDVVQLADTKFMIAIGDVSGKGTPASLLMANLQATIRALIKLELPLADITKRLNDLIHSSTSTDRFVTFFWGILDTDSHEFTYVNAGHNPPYIVRSNGMLERLTEGGIILGVLPTTVPYAQGIIKINPGDIIFMFTDGISEAMNSKNEEFGEERIEKILTLKKEFGVDEILHKLQEAIRRYTLGTPQSDDITVVLFKRLQ